MSPVGDKLGEIVLTWKEGVPVSGVLRVSRSERHVPLITSVISDWIGNLMLHFGEIEMCCARLADAIFAFY